MKKYKYLVVNGCSFTKGSCMYEDADKQQLLYKKNRFSKKLADRLNFEEINIAGGGRSNDRIFRELFNWVEENGEKVKDSLFVVGLSNSLRKDLYSSYLKAYFISTEIFQDMHFIAKDLGCSVEEVEQWRNFELKYLIDEYEIEKKIIRDCVLFDSLVDGNVLYFNAWRRSDVVHPKLKFVQFGNYWHGYNWYDFIIRCDPTWNKGHPKASHHHRMADILYKFINEKIMVR